MRHYKLLVISLISLFLIKCTTNYTKSVTYCEDQITTAFWVTALEEITLIDNSHNEIDITDSTIVVNFTTNDEADGYVKTTLSYTADGEATTITALGCTLESCYTMIPGTLIDTRVISNTDDEDNYYEEVTFTYETTTGEARRLSMHLYSDGGKITFDRNTYICVLDCTENDHSRYPGDDSCSTVNTSCDYTCDNGLNGSYKSENVGCSGEVIVSGVQLGNDCSVEKVVYPDLPSSFTAPNIIKSY